MAGVLALFEHFFDIAVSVEVGEFGGVFGVGLKLETHVGDGGDVIGHEGGLISARHYAINMLFRR